MRDCAILTHLRALVALRHAQPAARDRHRRHLRLPARAAARLRRHGRPTTAPARSALLAVRGKPTRAVQRAPRHRARRRRHWSARPARRCASTATARSASAPATSRAPPPACWPRPNVSDGDARVPVHAPTRKPTTRAASPRSSRSDRGFARSDRRRADRGAGGARAPRHRSVRMRLHAASAGHASAANALEPTAPCTRRCAGARARSTSSRRSRTRASAA